MNLRNLAGVGLAVACLQAVPALAQECTPGANPTPEQVARRKVGLTITRTINNLEANQPGAVTDSFLRQVELPTSPFASRATGASAEFLKQMNFTPGADVMPGWQLTLDLSSTGYWFMVKDKTDPCGFAFISNQDGLIFEAQPIR